MAAKESSDIQPTNVELYHYFPISYEGLSIRLLSLLPGVFSSRVLVKLHELPFPAPPASPNIAYEALSYAWGSTDSLQKIYVEDDDAGSCYVLRVTSNLMEALRYLRFEDKPRVLWVDAVCVDQHNTVDRNYHVGRMAHIYPSATRVIIWLGRDSEESDVAIELLRPLKDKVLIDWATRTMMPSSPEPSEAHWADRSVSLPFDESQMFAIHHLLGRPWFERLWVWQEVRLATVAHIQCGNTTLEWESFRSAVMLLFSKSLPPCAPRGFAKRAETALWLCVRYGYESLNTLLEFTKESKCSDERDRVYALLSITEAREQDLDVRADYNKPYYEVYKDAVVKHAINWSDLELFSTIDPSRRFEGRASWVPDWSKPRLSACLWWLKRFAPTYAVPIHLDEDRLQVSGISVATINDVEEFAMPFSGSISWQQIISALRTIIMRFGMWDKLLQSNTYRKEFCKVISVGRFSEIIEPPTSRFPTLEQGAAALHRILTDPDAHLLPIEENFFSHAKPLWSCTNNYSAWHIATILLGCNTPTILRPKANSSLYTVVGEGYLSGMMNSEVLLGPLPESYEQVAILDDKRSRLWWVLIDRLTGRIFVEDPRLGELPASWERKRHEDERFFSWFVNKETGEEFTRGFDPRMTSKALKHAGVKLQDFVLI
ncbi:heterokaryon incompatibility protein-domain-containing protein [Bisporella sp. PMI_857]|nr:heterokaryon incompatibility protein-domain-containing protein [Bisporella sp. PMI_857]KAH8600526.1 heterokaryon incompatibility protein-domain-containing protein [Bisporella sp. PMI_857]